MTRDRFTMLGDVLSRGIICALFALLTMNIWADFVKTGKFTGLLFLTSEGLVVVLTVVRRRAQTVDRSPESILLTVVSTFGPLFLHAGSVPALVPGWVTVTLSTIGVAIVVTGKMTIGRSFGLVPANRGIVVRGPYRLVRHPIYAGYLLTHISVMLGYPAPWNIAVILIGDTALILRALAEERMLNLDLEYQAYCGRVAWHLVPGLF